MALRNESPKKKKPPNPQNKQTKSPKKVQGYDIRKKADCEN